MHLNQPLIFRGPALSFPGSTWKLSCPIKTNNQQSEPSVTNTSSVRVTLWSTCTSPVSLYVDIVFDDTGHVVKTLNEQNLFRKHPRSSLKTRGLASFTPNKTKKHYSFPFSPIKTKDIKDQQKNPSFPLISCQSFQTSMRCSPFWEYWEHHGVSSGAASAP